MQVSIGGVVYVLTGTPNANGTELSKSFTDFKLTIKWDSTRSCIKAGIWFSTINKTYIVNWAKLELGGIATKNVPRLYAEDLSLCKRYYEYGEFPVYYVGGSSYFLSGFAYKVSKRSGIAPTVNIIGVSDENDVFDKTIQAFGANSECVPWLRLGSGSAASGIQSKTLLVKASMDSEFY